MTAMKIRELQPQDRDAWLAMRHALWPEHTLESLAAEIADHFNDDRVSGLPTKVYVAEQGDGRLAGFVEVSLRPYARGCVSSPVGYVEGWYVAEDLRRRGVGKALIDAAGEWARSRGCNELASDRGCDNFLSRSAHLALGFTPPDKNEFFRKALADRAVRASECIGFMPFALDIGAITDFVSDGGAGGIAVFLGTTRAERSSDGRDLIALDYEAYEEMALKQMRELAQTARQRWPVVKLAILHRVGRVEIARPSVVIAISTPHRGDAFDCCRFLIDELKKSVAIWKKEVWSDGSASWVHPVGDK